MPLGRPARSVLVFGLYMTLPGLALLLVPEAVLRLSGLPWTGEVWVRVVGMITLILAFYYLTAARHDLTPFLEASVPGRGAAAVCLTALVLLGGAAPLMLISALIELAGAAWTALELRAERARAVRP